MKSLFRVIYLTGFLKISSRKALLFFLFESFASEGGAFECPIRGTKGSFASEHKVFVWGKYLVFPSEKLMS